MIDLVSIITLVAPLVLLGVFSIALKHTWSGAPERDEPVATVERETPARATVPEPVEPLVGANERRVA